MSVNEGVARLPERRADAEVGRAVHMLMWDRQVKQAELSSRLGIQQSALSKKLRGHRPWTVDELIVTAAFLQTSVGYLVGETREEAPMVHPLGLEPRTHCFRVPRGELLEFRPSRSRHPRLDANEAVAS